jgi:polysaccharide deacetylase 2 family uncharacterized protein YibQ
LFLAIVVGGWEAVKGLPLIAEAIVPPGSVATEARAPQTSVTLRVRVSAAATNFSTAVLAPVEAHDAPRWLLAGRGRTLPVAAPPTHAAERGPAIAIVIDDLGNDVVAARRAIALPKAVTLSFLPYPDATQMLAREAIRAGHEILVHVPMEPEGNEDAGPMALRVGLPNDEIMRRLDWAFARVPGFSGINNHMGSRFTADRKALVPVMQALAARHVFFLDSRTTAKSQIVDLAQSLGVPTARRDVFLDDQGTSVQDELRLTEVRAKEQGAAIAIGHPHAETLSALEKWTSSVSLRRVVLVPVSEIVRRGNTHTELRAQIAQ